MAKESTKNVAAEPAAKETVRRRAKRPVRSRLTLDQREEMFRRLCAQRPKPEPELNYRDAYTLLVAVTLSAQSTDIGVNRATATLFDAAPTPAAMVALGVDDVGEHIRTIGLWRNKAKNVVALSEALLRDHGGEVPAERDALTKLPGVGRKTANVVLNIAFGQPVMAVDTHIFRLGNRIGVAPGKTPDAVEQALYRAVPEPYLLDAHHWLILHGRYVCKARKPSCDACVIADLCKYRDKTSDVPAPVVEIVGGGPPPSVQGATLSTS